MSENSEQTERKPVSHEVVIALWRRQIKTRDIAKDMGVSDRRIRQIIREWQKENDK